MRKEPEIVHILHEDERLGKLKMKSSDSFGNIELSEEVPINTTNDNIVLGVSSKDISENKKPEQTLVKIEKIYKAMFELFSQTLLLIDKNGIILDVNEQMEKWLGYKTNEILGMNIFDVPFLTKKSKKTVKKNFSYRLINKTIPTYEIEIHTKSDGKLNCGRRLHPR